jgi:hypothetical protein
MTAYERYEIAESASRHLNASCNRRRELCPLSLIAARAAGLLLRVEMEILPSRQGAVHKGLLPIFSAPNRAGRCSRAPGR